MQTLSAAEFALRLGVGLGCGAAIGIERQWRARMAGLRTDALVAAGATLFVLYSVAADDLGSPTRVATYVVSGIGFLGGGVILRDGFTVRGLTPPRPCGARPRSGYWLRPGCLRADRDRDGAGRARVGPPPLGRLIDHDHPAEEDEDLQPYRLYLTCRRKSEQHIRALIVQHTSGHDITLRGIRTTRADTADTSAGSGTTGSSNGAGSGEAQLTAHLLLDGDAAGRLEQLVARLSLEPGIHAVHWHSADEPDPTLVRSATACPPASAED